MVTWKELAQLEPELAEIEAEIMAREWKLHAVAGMYCGNARWYRAYKPRVVQLVGWSARNRDAVLASRDAYDVAYRHLCDLVPGCRGCSCLALP